MFLNKNPSFMFNNSENNGLS